MAMRVGLCDRGLATSGEAPRHQLPRALAGHDHISKLTLRGLR